MLTKRKVYQRIASALQAMENCKRLGTDDWLERHRETILHLVTNHMPSGAGVDNGVHFDFITSNPNRLVFDTSYHHMSDAGYYDGWTEHSIIVTPDLASGFDLRVNGRDRRDIKEYLAEIFGYALDADIDDSVAFPVDRKVA